MWSIPFAGFLGELPRQLGIVLIGLVGLSYVLGSIKYCIWFPFAWFLISQMMVDNYHGLTHLQKYLQTGMLLCLDKKKQGGVSSTPFPQINGKNRGMT
jgi:hypothetical protein